MLVGWLGVTADRPQAEDAGNAKGRCREIDDNKDEINNDNNDNNNNNNSNNKYYNNMHI